MCDFVIQLFPLYQIKSVYNCFDNLEGANNLKFYNKYIWTYLSMHSLTVAKFPCPITLPIVYLLRSWVGALVSVSPTATERSQKFDVNIIIGNCTFGGQLQKHVDSEASLKSRCILKRKPGFCKQCFKGNKMFCRLYE